ncbi:hypothetical protein EJB05_14183, partial [Eragrostis curvula]
MQPPELIDDAIAEILLRVPPDEPAHLIRAAEVCKPWRRILSDGAFRRRYRALHRSPFLLGFLQNLCDDGSIPRFVFAAAAPRLPIPAFPCASWYALDCRHGRALLRSLGPEGLIVWDPMSSGHKEVAVPAYPYHWCNATVFCATDDCDHRDCRGGPFTVVFTGTDNEPDATWACTYLSETDAWSAPTILTEGNGCILEQRPSLLTADGIYFIHDYSKRILKYDMTGQTGLSVIYAPDFYHRPEGIAIAADDGGLGFAGVKFPDVHVGQLIELFKGFPTISPLPIKPCPAILFDELRLPTILVINLLVPEVHVIPVKLMRAPFRPRAPPLDRNAVALIIVVRLLVAARFPVRLVVVLLPAVNCATEVSLPRPRIDLLSLSHRRNGDHAGGRRSARRARSGTGPDPARPGPDPTHPAQIHTLPSPFPFSRIYRFR